MALPSAETRLHDIMRDMYAQTYEASARYGNAGDYVLRASNAGFVTATQAMLDQGVV